MKRIKVWYLKANDASGIYRWYTDEMASVGQFEHANSLEEIEQKAKNLVSVELIEQEEDN